MLIQSCGPYQKALKSEDIKLKYDKAEAFMMRVIFEEQKGFLSN